MHLIVYNTFTFTASIVLEILVAFFIRKYFYYKLQLSIAACCVLCKKILNTGSVGGDKNMMYKKRNYAFF